MPAPARDPATPPRLLSIAGSDSGAGAGIQADLKTFSAFSCYGTTAITAITAQNTLGVSAVEGVSPELVSRQIESVLSDIGVDAVKTGMLFSTEVILAVVGTFEKHWEREDHPPLVIDPVLVSTSGHSLLPESAVAALRDKLLPWATVITPNVPEAEVLSSWEGKISSVEDMRECAKKLGKLGARWIYLKGGHLLLENGGKKVVYDLLWDAREGMEVLSERPYLQSKNTHGTGCTLSAAIASELAKGSTVPEAVLRAADFVATAISTSYPLGSGSGPVNHFHAMGPRSLPLPTALSPTPFTDYLIAYNPDAWHRYVHHPFPTSLARGDAPLSSFLHFIQQDYHFLKQYGRVHALAAYKTEDMEEMAASMEIVSAVVKETEMHIKYCERYNITRAQLLSLPESVTSIAYSRYVLDTSSKGDLLDLRVVTAPCLIGYGQVGARLVEGEGAGFDKSEGNPYWGWIAEYGGDWYQGAVKTGIDLLEATVAKSPISASRLEDLAKIFVQATELEVAFWDAAVAAADESP